MDFRIPPLTEHTPLLGEFRTNPEANRLKTPSGKIEIYSQTIAGYGYDVARLTPLDGTQRMARQGRPQYPLHLLSNQPVTRLQSARSCQASRGSKISGASR